MQYIMEQMAPLHLKRAQVWQCQMLLVLLVVLVCILICLLTLNLSLLLLSLCSVINSLEVFNHNQRLNKRGMAE